MSRWEKYRDKAAALAAPYLKSAGEYAEAAAGRINRTYHRGQKKVKRRMRILKWKQALDTVSNLLLLASLVLAVLTLIKTYWLDELD